MFFLKLYIQGSLSLSLFLFY